jgi:hypothetical protein
MTEERDIADVIAEERSRGSRRKRLDRAEIEKQRKTRADLARVLRTGDERGFLDIMRALGLKDGSPEFARALKAFREQSGGHG